MNVFHPEKYPDLLTEARKADVLWKIKTDDLGYFTAKGNFPENIRLIVFRSLPENPLSQKAGYLTFTIIQRIVFFITG